MGNIIKRRHTNQYAQIHNNPLQKDLIDLRTIGLLAYLMSLPNDWIIYKTQLYNKFSRKNIDAAWKELAQKNYIIGFNCYVNGKKQSYYNVSDIPFLPEEFNEFVYDTVVELINSKLSVKSVGTMKFGNYDIPEDLTTVLKVQYSQYSTLSTTTNKIIINKKITKKYDDDIPKASLSNMNNLTQQNLNIKNPGIQSKITPTLSNNEFLKVTDLIREYYKEKIKKRSFDAVLKKCINNYKKGTVPNFENYLITAIENKITELELRRKQEKNSIAGSKRKKITRQEIVPEWLNEQKMAERNEKEREENQKSTIEVNIDIERQKLLEELNKYKKDK